ncbi:MAG: translation initiation factor IF-3 [Acidobacteria bacterium]|nr:translation initiation factor IF-3 [Acidobacteriota bacterium]
MKPAPKNENRDRVRINEEITAPEVRLIDGDGAQLGVVPIAQALALATEKQVDLVEIAPNAEPPVAKVMDYGKFLYQQKKKQHDAKKKQKVVQIKEVKFRPRTDTHDFEFKKKHIIRFLEEGNRVKCGVFFRGREMAYPELGYELLARLVEELEGVAEMVKPPEMEGRLMVMHLMPKK